MAEVVLVEMRGIPNGPKGFCMSELPRIFLAFFFVCFMAPVAQI